MRCEDCPALCIEGYEYPESYCSVYSEDDCIDFADGSCGCKHPLNAIKKRIKLNEEAQAHQYDGIIEFYQEESNKEQAVLESLLVALNKEECCIAYTDLNHNLRQIDISIFDQSDESLMCDSLTRKIVSEFIYLLNDNGYEIKKRSDSNE